MLVGMGIALLVMVQFKKKSFVCTHFLLVATQGGDERRVHERRGDHEHGPLTLRKVYWGTGRRARCPDVAHAG